MKCCQTVIIGMLVLAASSFAHADTVYVWYGNLDGSPIEARIDTLVDIDVYLFTTTNAIVSDFFLCLGAEDNYFSAMVSDDYGMFYEPYDDWYHSFTPQYGYSPAPGWSSQGVVFLDNDGFIHFDAPARVLKMVCRSADDPSLIGDTAECLGLGLHPFMGSSCAGDKLGGPGYPVVEYFSPVYFTGVTEVDDKTISLPANFALEQNYPNPFNGATFIAYGLPVEAHVVLKIYDILGREVETMANQRQPAGYYQVQWRAADLPSGVYFYSLKAGSFVETRRMLLLK